MSSNYFNYLCLLIASDKGITQQTDSLINIGKQIINLLVNSLQIPFIVVFTKIDLISEQTMETLLLEFRERIASFKIYKNVICMKEYSDVELFSRNLEENVLPVFQVCLTSFLLLF